MKYLTLRLEGELHKALKLCAVTEGRSIVAVVVQAIKEYLERGKP